jgi:hypothetical protein
MPLSQVGVSQTLATLEPEEEALALLDNVPAAEELLTVMVLVTAPALLERVPPTEELPPGWLVAAAVLVGDDVTPLPACELPAWEAPVSEVARALLEWPLLAANVLLEPASELDVPAAPEEPPPADATQFPPMQTVEPAHSAFELHEPMLSSRLGQAHNTNASNSVSHVTCFICSLQGQADGAG